MAREGVFPASWFENISKTLLPRQTSLETIKIRFVVAITGFARFGALGRRRRLTVGESISCWTRKWSRKCLLACRNPSLTLFHYPHAGKVADHALNTRKACFDARRTSGVRITCTLGCFKLHGKLCYWVINQCFAGRCFCVRAPFPKAMNVWHTGRQACVCRRA